MKNKHFRKDVILARVIAAIILIVLIIIISLVVSNIMKSSGNDKTTQDTQTEDQDLNYVDSDDETESEPDIYVKTTELLKLRSEASTSSEVLIKLQAGTELLVLETLEGWYKVSYNGMEGYVSADYVELVEDENQVIRNANDIIIMLDPGHQTTASDVEEANGPDASDTTARMTSGNTGTSTGVKEYELTLEIALLLRDELQNRGYTVKLTRETNDVDISEMERALLANREGADIMVRLHADADYDSSVYGAEVLAPSSGNVYAGDIAEDSQELSKSIINAYCTETGMNNLGVKIDDTITGINWSEIPVTMIELGYLSNPTDDTNMQDDAYQQKMIKGIADGIDDYFGL